MHLSDTVALLVVLLLAVVIVSALLKRLPIPFTVALVTIGIALGLLREQPAFHGLAQLRLSPDLILFIFLPTLLFAAAFHINARHFLEVLPPVLALAVPGVVLCALVVGATMWLGAGVALPVALLFGAVVSATDPVAVLAIFRELGVSRRLAMLMDGESLLNDGTALVLFQTLLAIVIAGQALTLPTGLAAIWSFSLVSLGGAAAGAALALVIAQFFQRVHDAMVEITLAIILAYGSFLLAEEYLHVSGVIATLTSGLVLGNYGRTKISPDALEAVEAYWRYAGFAAEALLFLLVGLSVSWLDLAAQWQAVIWAILAVLLSRGATIYLLVPALNLAQREKIDWRFQTVMFWGGLRGAVAIAIALGLPDSFAHKDLLITLTLGVVLFTLFVNALTIRPLVMLLGLGRATAEEVLQKHTGLLIARQRADEMIDRLAQEGVLSERIGSDLQTHYRRLESRVARQLAELRQNGGARLEQDERVVMQYCLMLERRQYERLFAQGDVDEGTLKQLLHDVEDRLDRLRGGGSLAAWQHWLTTLTGPLRRYLRHLPAAQPLLSQLGAIRLARAYEADRAQLLASREVDQALAKLRATQGLAEPALAAAQAAYDARRHRLEREIGRIEDQFPEFAAKVHGLITTRFRLGAEGAAFRELHEAGLVADSVLEEVQQAIDDEFSQLHRIRIKDLLRRPADLVRGVSFFADLPDEVVATITGALILRTYLEGEVIVAEGEVGDSLYLIGRGVVEVSTTTAAGERVLIATLRAGEVVGEMALLTSRRRLATATALTPCNLLQLRRSDLRRAMRTHPLLHQVLAEAYKQRVGLAVLSHLPAFAAVAPEIRQQAASRLELLRLAPGSEHRPGIELPGVLWIVRSGRVDLTDSDGRKRTLHEEDCFGAPPLFPSAPRQVRCPVETELLALRALPADLTSRLE
ncbi:MAG: cation:proton antiporter [Chloroflexi bacterium]|nr:cation:proton antiporter [Chloroflexota bacterium]